MSFFKEVPLQNQYLFHVKCTEKFKHFFYICPTEVNRRFVIERT